MAETSVPPRPRQVTFGGIASATACGLLVLVLFDQMAAVRSLETRQALADSLSRPPWQGLGIGVGQAVDALRVLMLVSGALAAAGCILGIYALRRHRGARVGLTVVAVLMMFSAVLVTDVLPIVVIVAAGMLWTRESRAWFDGRVLEPDPPAVPAGRSSAAQPGWAPPAVESRVVTDDPATWPPPRVAASQPPAGPGPRPVPVTVALAIVWATCGLTFVSMIAVMAWALADKMRLYDLVREQQPGRAASSANDVLGLVLVGCVVLCLWCLAAAAATIPAAQRRNWARVALVVNAFVVGLVAMVLVAGTGALLLVVVAAVAVVVLLLVPSVNAWYAGRPPGPREPSHRDDRRPQVW
jgi:hypothetical protein